MAFFCIAFTNCNDEKPKILIVGDSISIGYTPYVKNNLGNRAKIYHNPGNAKHTNYGLQNIKEWAQAENWDIIQFNWGLWDICHRTDDDYPDNKSKRIGVITTSKSEYAKNIDSIVSILKASSDAKLIFVTTTHVPEDDAGRHSADVYKYNDIAIEIMTRRGVFVNEVHQPSITIHELFGEGKNDVHYNSLGYEKLSEIISQYLIEKLDTTLYLKPTIAE